MARSDSELEFFHESNQSLRHVAIQQPRPPTAILLSPICPKPERISHILAAGWEVAATEYWRKPFHSVAIPAKMTARAPANGGGVVMFVVRQAV